VIDALSDFIERWQDQTGVTVDLHIDDTGRAVNALSAIAELQLLRIVQEALSNIRKHSGATRAVISIEEQDAGVLVQIRDDGAGFDPETFERRSIPRFGLSIMRERAAAVGGWLEIDSERGKGTRVTAFIPAQVQAPRQREASGEGSDSR
jgi:signal transduction histidine kinase